MVFDIDTALKVRNYYKDILIGKPLTDEPNLKILGAFICHKGNVHRALDILRNKNFDENHPLIGITDEKAKDFEIYVYAKTGTDLLFQELDKNLTQKGIEKNYIIN